jgi:predicted RNase H-like HicB family nuclease
MPIREAVLCFWKHVLSYRKSNWAIMDYPLRYGEKNEQAAGEKSMTWSVQVIKWWGMFGSGRTKKEAFKNLQDSFEKYKNASQALPRPGTEVPIQFASSSKIEQLEDIAVDFFPAILGYDFHGIFVSDESSVFDFGVDEQEIIVAINTRYGLQLTTLADGNIVRILYLVKARQQ